MTLPLFVSRRRDPITCSNCGAKLERVLPGIHYYSLRTAATVLQEAAVPGVIVLALFKGWVWVAVVVVALSLVNLGVSSFLNSRTSVEFADPKDARKDVPSRWYPT